MIVMNADNVKSNVIATRGMSEIPTPLREDLVVFGLARMIAYGTVIPSNPVDNPVAFFADNSKTAKGVVSVVNEGTVVNMAKVLEMAGVIYRARYDMVHTPFTKAAIGLAQSALIASGSYNFPQSIADALTASEDSDALGRSIGFAINMFSINETPAMVDLDAVVPATAEE